VFSLEKNEVKRSRTCPKKEVCKAGKVGDWALPASLKEKLLAEGVGTSAEAKVDLLDGEGRK
jgi:hypothetical protein